MEEIGSWEARTHFSELLRRVEKGEAFVVTMRGKPIATLTAVVPSSGPRSVGEILKEFGAMREKIVERGPILAPGESWKELGREGLKW